MTNFIQASLEILMLTHSAIVGLGWGGNNFIIYYVNQGFLSFGIGNIVKY